ncbi:glycosyltransferase family 2 protein [Rhizobium sp. LjRoot254]|uniref:glycosyltransferase family 2 protein n=1 Tax=Rhizobium sp. LjRoot254 TaxID=3342297 RepID=UPI003ECEB9F7
MIKMAPAEQPLVSCIVIFYNADRYISDALESVAAQTWLNWELVLVDDGSTDNSRSITEAFAARYPERVHILEHPGRVNLGKSVARNVGFSAAKGEFIAMLDADDVWLPEKLAEQVALMAAYPEVDIVYGKVEFWYSWTGKPRDALKKYTSALGIPADTPQDARRLLEVILRQTARGVDEVTPYPSAMMFRRALLERSGACDPDFKFLHDDVVFFVKAFLVAKIYAADRIWAKYRVAPDDTYSLSFEAAFKAGDWSEGGEPERRLLERAEQYVASASPPSKRLVRALRHARLQFQSPQFHRLWRHLWAFKQMVKQPILIAAQAWNFHVRDRAPRVGFVRWGYLQRRVPLQEIEYVNGQAIDRYFARAFCQLQGDHITGDVLEFGDSAQTRRFGKDTRSVSVAPGGSALDKDFEAPGGGLFDCVIAIDVIQYQRDVAGSLSVLLSLLRPGGSLIISFPALIPSLDQGDLWRFTEGGVRELLSANLASSTIEIVPYGNTAAAVAMLHGLGLRDLKREFHSGQDARNAVLIMACVTRSGTSD